VAGTALFAGLSVVIWRDAKVQEAKRISARPKLVGHVRNVYFAEPVRLKAPAVVQKVWRLILGSELQVVLAHDREADHLISHRELMPRRLTLQLVERLSTSAEQRLRLAFPHATVRRSRPLVSNL
jgi:hypothetical protein